jgi:hypothetical protein
MGAWFNQLPLLGAGTCQRALLAGTAGLWAGTPCQYDRAPPLQHKAVILLAAGIALLLLAAGKAQVKLPAWTLQWQGSVRVDA